jgi:hypothetical protein
MSYVATFEPTAVPEGFPDLRAWIASQLRRVADTLAMPTVRGVHFAVLHAEPARYSDGDVVLADGSDWDPGSGGGLYQHFGGNWVKL